MAYATIEQRDIIASLVRQYGPSFVKIEHTDEPYGLIWARWNNGPRNLFIRPDGTRLSWDSIES